MAMDIYIIMTPGSEPDVDFLNHQSKALELGLSFADEALPTEADGEVSVTFQGETSGFRMTRVADTETLLSSLPAYAPGLPESPTVYHIRFGYAHFSPVSAYHTAAIYSTLDNVVVYETQNNGYKDTTQLIMIGKQMYDSLYRHN